MNCGNLSRAIQDHKQKSYEKTTVSFVSKHISDQNKSQATTEVSGSNIYKHLKNSSMAGSGDFFRNAGNSTSISNKKQY